jgi:hypothetical protein
MRTCITILLFCVAAAGQNLNSPAGQWMSVMKLFEERLYARLQLDVTGNKLTGKLGDDIEKAETRHLVSRRVPQPFAVSEDSRS